MEFVSKSHIQLDKVITDLDRFVLDFIDILQKHTDYVLVSGYVAILFGRSRGTEDIDAIIPKMSFSKFKELFEELSSKGYWFLNSDDVKDLFEILSEDSSIRAAVKDRVIPNMELKFIKNDIDRRSLKDRLTVSMRGHSLFISPIELQIAYKEEMLKSEKDMEDALHLREVFKDRLDMKALQEFKENLK